MIRKLTQADHEPLMIYLTKEKAMNLFLIGDIEAFGYDKDFQELWGDIDEAGRLRGVLLRYYGSYIPYSQGTDFDLAGFASLIRKDDGLDVMSGKKEVVDLFAACDLPVQPARELFFAELTDDALLDPALDISSVKLATLDDVDRIMDLRETIAEFDINRNARASLISTMESGMGRTFYTEDESGQMVACASTTAENSQSAMIVGVCTRSEQRGKGLASLCMTALCKQLLSENRTLCLFYDNPQAGAIYKRLGFRDIGIWTMRPRTQQEG